MFVRDCPSTAASSADSRRGSTLHISTHLRCHRAQTTARSDSPFAALPAAELQTSGALLAAQPHLWVRLDLALAVASMAHSLAVRAYPKAQSRALRHLAVQFRQSTARRFSDGP